MSIPRGNSMCPGLPVASNHASMNCGYNLHQQIESILVNKPAVGVNYLLLSNSYCTTNTSTQDCAYNNGNLMAQVINHANNNPITQTFGYDRANRLTSAVEAPAGGTGWNQTYGYDRYGNQWVNGGTVLSSFTPTSPSNYDSSTNRMNLIGHDAAGNMNVRGSNALTWDAEGRRILDVQPIKR